MHCQTEFVQQYQKNNIEPSEKIQWQIWTCDYCRAIAWTYCQGACERIESSRNTGTTVTKLACLGWNSLRPLASKFLTSILLSGWRLSQSQSMLTKKPCGQGFRRDWKWNLGARSITRFVLSWCFAKRQWCMSEIFLPHRVSCRGCWKPKPSTIISTGTVYVVCSHLPCSRNQTTKTYFRHRAAQTIKNNSLDLYELNKAAFKAICDLGKSSKVHMLWRRHTPYPTAHGTSR